MMSITVVVLISLLVCYYLVDRHLTMPVMMWAKVEGRRLVAVAMLLVLGLCKASAQDIPKLLKEIEDGIEHYDALGEESERYNKENLTEEELNKSLSLSFGISQGVLMMNTWEELLRDKMEVMTPEQANRYNHCIKEMLLRNILDSESDVRIVIEADSVVSTGTNVRIRYQYNYNDTTEMVKLHHWDWKKTGNGCDVIYGPSQSTSITSSCINGETATSYSQSFNFIVLFRKPGMFTLPQMKATTSAGKVVKSSTFTLRATDEHTR